MKSETIRFRENLNSYIDKNKLMSFQIDQLSAKLNFLEQQQISNQSQIQQLVTEKQVMQTIKSKSIHLIELTAEKLLNSGIIWQVNARAKIENRSRKIVEATSPNQSKQSKQQPSK